MINRALIIAGGRGLRLGEITEDIPKGMLPVLGKPILQWMIEWLERNGVTNIGLGLDYNKEKIMDYFGDGKKFGVNIKYSDHHDAEGTGDAFRIDIENLGIKDDSFFAMNGDELTDLSLRNLVTFHKEHNPIATLVVAPLISPYGVVDIDYEFNIKNFREKPVVDNLFMNTGIYLFTKEIIPYLPKKGNIEQTTFKKLAEEGRLKAFKYFGFYRTIDTIKDLKTTEERLKNLKF